jgi:RNA polymerase sigma-70 factor (ECF subfamily)
VRENLVLLSGLPELPQSRPGSPRVDPLVDQVRALLEGNTAALEPLLRALAPNMLRVIRAVLGSSHPDAEDLLQDSLISLTHALGKFRFESSVSHFALTIAFRQALTAKRRQQHVAQWIDTFQKLEEPLTCGPSSPAQTLETERRRALLEELLTNIPEAQAEALGLRVVAGLSIEQIARTTKVPENTVRSRLRLAKGALRKAIELDAVLSELLEREA